MRVNLTDLNVGKDVIGIRLFCAIWTLDMSLKCRARTVLSESTEMFSIQVRGWLDVDIGQRSFEAFC